MKKVSFTSDEGKYVVISAKLNAKIFGKKQPQNTKTALKEVPTIAPARFAELEKKGKLVFSGITYEKGRSHRAARSQDCGSDPDEW